MTARDGSGTASGWASPAMDGRRFGITAAGLVFTHQPAVAEDPDRTMELLAELKGEEPFVVRLNRLYWSGETGTIDHAVREARRYAAEGFEVSLQLRYGGPGEHLPEGGPAAFAKWTRNVVRAVANNDAVVGVEVTNEPNLAVAPDNSDGAFEGVHDALIAGVMAASEESDRADRRVPIGFNWFHHTGAADETTFWSYLGEHGGKRLAGSLDWVGLNVYPGTYDFADIAPGEEAAETERALAALRLSYLPMAMVPATTPIRVTEFGWPDGEGRTQQEQSEKLREMLAAIERCRRAYNVTDVYWFDLRDSDSSRAKNESHYGLVTSDYRKKVAFSVFQKLVNESLRQTSAVSAEH